MWREKQNLNFIVKIKFIPSSLRELNVEAKIFSFDAINDLEKLKKIIENRLGRFLGTYKLSFSLQLDFNFNKTDLLKIVEFVIKFLAINKKSLSILFLEHKTEILGDDITIYLSQELLINQAYQNNVNIDITREIKNIFNIDTNINFSLLNKKEQKNEVTIKEHEKPVYVDLAIGKMIQMQGQIFDIQIKERPLDQFINLNDLKVFFSFISYSTEFVNGIFT